MKFCALLLVGLIASTASGDFQKPKNGTTRVLVKKEDVFINRNCDLTDTCNLKSFFLRAEDYEVWVEGEPAYGTQMHAGYETSSVETLRDYVIVNFMRGCRFYSKRNENGIIDNVLGFSVVNFPRDEYDYKFFCFPDWVIDSLDRDPVYNSDPSLGRHHLYRWNENVNSYSGKTEKLYGVKKPIMPVLYVRDTIGSAYLNTGIGEASNISLEFKTCIYKEIDVPTETNEDNINFATPIACFGWRSSYIYSHSLGKFESKTGLDPFCLQKPPKY